MCTITRLFQVLREEMANINPRYMLVSIFVAPFPRMSGSRTRALALKLAGFRIGRGVIFCDMPRIVGDGPITERLTVGDNCFFNIGLTMELGANISIGKHVSFGHDVMLLTTTHKMG